MAETMLECLNSRKNGVRIEFCKRRDRFEHTIFGVRNGVAEPLLMSFESSDEEFIPLSPHWAELHRQEDTLFLTGATTLAHWSMSVQPAQLTEELSSNLFDKRFGLNEPPKQRCHFLSFDVACRLKAKPKNLGSHYQCAEFAQIIPFGSGNQVFCANSEKYPYSVIFGSISLTEHQECRIAAVSNDPNERQLRVGPYPSAAKIYPTTIQWRYGVCWAL